MGIRFYNHIDIKKQHWDEQLRKCANRLIYAESVYLDHMSAGWCALIDESTGNMMPLPVQQRMGIRYALQPPFTQQLGVFFLAESTQAATAQFTAKAATISAVMDLYLNYANPMPGSKERCNYILDLGRPFDVISSRFRKDLVTGPLAMNLTYTEASIDEAFRSYRDFVLPKNHTLSENHLQQFEQLSRYYLQQKRAFARKVISPAGDLLSVALFLKDEHRIYYMLSANTLDGRTASSNALLIYEVIREFAGSGLIFDFEGSEIPGVKFFFEKFSPVNQPYYHLTAGRLFYMRKIAGTVRSVINKLR